MLTFNERTAPSEARDRIITTTRQMLERHEETVHLGDIAIRAGVSRQTLYYQFRGKADLLSAVCSVVDADVRDLETEAAAALQHLDPRVALRAYVESRAGIEPRLHALASGLERLRVFDRAAQAVWRDREERRYGVIAALAERLRADGCLASGWVVPHAARMIWAVTSHRAWSELVTEAGWTSQQWSEHTLALLEGAFVAGTTA
jgi:AcrR family transcriptional regulator